MLGVTIPVLATSATAQTRYASSRTRSARIYHRPNFYRRHRKAINIGVGTGAGLLVGGLIGGRRGAAIGGLAGAGGGWYYTHKQRPKNHARYYRRY